MATEEADEEAGRTQAGVQDLACALPRKPAQVRVALGAERTRSSPVVPGVCIPACSEKAVRKF